MQNQSPQNWDTRFVPVAIIEVGSNSRLMEKISQAEKDINSERKEFIHQRYIFGVDPIVPQPIAL